MLQQFEEEFIEKKEEDPINSGLYQQIENASITDYNKLTSKDLEDFVMSLTDDGNTDLFVWDKLTNEQESDYARILDLVKDGYLYTFGDNDDVSAGVNKFIITTGSGGARNYIEACIKDNVPPSIVIPGIIIHDDENNISMKLMNVKWMKIETTKPE